MYSPSTPGVMVGVHLCGGNCVLVEDDPLSWPKGLLLSLSLMKWQPSGSNYSLTFIGLVALNLNVTNQS